MVNAPATPESFFRRMLLGSLTGAVVWLVLQFAPASQFTPRPLSVASDQASALSLAVNETSSVAVELLATQISLAP
jgi:Na+/proline symporter